MASFFSFLQSFPPSKLPLESKQINTFVPRFLRSDLTNYNHDDIHSPPRTIPSTTKTDLDPKGTVPTESRNVINSSSRFFKRAPLYHPLARRSTTTKSPRATSSLRDCARVIYTYIYKAARDTVKRYGCRPPGVSRVWRRPAERGTNRRKLCEKLLRGLRVIFCDNGSRTP